MQRLFLISLLSLSTLTAASYREEPSYIKRDSEKLFKAIENYNIKEVENILKEYCSWKFKDPRVANRKNSEGQTPLHQVIPSLGKKVEKEKIEKIIWLLINSDADIEAKDSAHETPLCKAVSNEQWEAINFLVKCGASISWQDNEGQKRDNYFFGIPMAKNTQETLTKISSKSYVELFKAFMCQNIEEMQRILKAEPQLVLQKDWSKQTLLEYFRGTILQSKGSLFERKIENLLVEKEKEAKELTSKTGIQTNQEFLQNTVASNNHEIYKGLEWCLRVETNKNQLRL